MNPLIIDADIPAGNILLEGIEGDEVRLRVDPRDTEGFWFYWCFRVRGAGGRRLRFRFADGPAFSIRGPARSLDRGQTWQWLGAEAAGEWFFDYVFAPEEDEVWFSMGMPYTARDLQRFVASHADSPHLLRDELCRSRGGRPVERLWAGRVDGEPAHRVVFTARHHCCEMMASYVLEGLLEAVLADDQVGAWYRGHVEVLALPFMDADGVEAGDQGKNRRPHDHNRDYGGGPIYPEVLALQEYLPAWSGGKLCVALDLHCPLLRGGQYNGTAIYLVGSPSPRMWQEQQRFGQALEAACVSGALPYRAANNLPFGQGWNTAPADVVRSAGRWFGSRPGVRLASTMEIPYADVHGVEMNADSARDFGRRLAAAIRGYIQEPLPAQA